RGMLGCGDGEAIGRTGELAFGDHADWSRFLKLCIPALERTGTFEGEWQVRRKDGSPWWCQISAKALNPANLGHGTIWFFLDISARKWAEEEVQRALLRERELADLKMRFVSLASHEFRTPLATILSSVELIEQYSERLPAQEKAEIIGSIKIAVKRMTSMLEHILLIGRADSGHLTFEPAPLNLRE